MKFSLRDLLLVTVIVALDLGLRNRVRPIASFLSALCVVSIAALSGFACEETEVSKEKEENPTALSKWLPPDCETMIFVHPPDGDLQRFSNYNTWDSGSALVQMPLNALSGLHPRYIAKELDGQKIKAVAAGATGFRLVKHGPAAVVLCRGCVIVEFVGDLGEGGKNYLSKLEKNGGKSLVIQKELVVQTKGRLVNDGEGELFTAHPVETLVVFANDLDLIKQCLARIKAPPREKPEQNEQLWLSKYAVPEANFVAVSKQEKSVKFVLTWSKENESVVDVAWVPEDIKEPLSDKYVGSILEFWTLPPPVSQPPTLVKKEKESIRLRLDLKNKEKWEFGMYLILVYLGFGGYP